MNERDKTAHMMQASAGNSWGTEAHFQEFADLIRADERERLEQAVEELAPVRDNPLLQNKPAAFWIESFKQIVRGDV